MLLLLIFSSYLLLLSTIGVDSWCCLLNLMVTIYCYLLLLKYGLKICDSI